MADQIITLTIPSDKVAVALQGFLAIYPNDEKNEDMTPKYSDKNWVAEKERRLLVRDIRRGLQMIVNQTSKVAEDNTIVQ